MNGTHRGLNRALLGVLGVLLLAAGALAAVAGTSRGFALAWTRTGTRVWARIQEELGAARILESDVSWWTVALVALLLTLGALLVWWIASQGAGRSNQLAWTKAPDGATAVDANVADQAVKAALAANAAVLYASAQSWRVSSSHGETGLKLTIQARTGASPTELMDAVGQVVDGLDGLLGIQLPVLVRITAGARAKFSRTMRVA